MTESNTNGGHAANEEPSDSSSGEPALSPTASTPQPGTSNIPDILLAALLLVGVIAGVLGIADSPWVILSLIGAGFLAFFLKAREVGASPARIVKFGVLPAVLILGLALLNDRAEQQERDQLIAEAAGPQVELGGSLNIAGDDLATNSSLTELAIPLFLIDRFEVTNKQYAACEDAGECDPLPDRSRIDDAGAADWPVTGVAAHHAFQFCQWLGRRLPSEVEWLFAARGDGVGREWPWGSDGLDETRANLAFVALPVDSEDDEIPDPAEDPEGFEKWLERTGGGTSESPLGNPVPQSEKALGQTPGAAESGIAHLLGNAWEWTATSPELCSDRADCSTAWTPELRQAATLVLRGHAYTTEVLLEEPDTYRNLMVQGVLADVSLLADDTGFRCAGEITSGEETQ